MEPLDVFKQISSRFVLRTVTPMVYSLSFQHSEEPLTGGVVSAMANRAHTADQMVTAQITLVIAAGELAAAV